LIRDTRIIFFAKTFHIFEDTVMI